MKNSADYLAHVIELMHPAGVASARPMFGGHGLYLGGVIVAIVIDDVLYLKTDDENRPTFAAQGLEPFRYVTKEGEVHVTSYHRAPDAALDGVADMGPWLRSAHEAALRRKGAPRAATKRKTASL